MKRRAWPTLVCLLVGCAVQQTSLAPVEPSSQNDPAALSRLEFERSQTSKRAAEEIERARTSGSKADLRVAYAQYLTSTRGGIERTRRSIEYAELLIEIGSFDEAATHLRSAIERPELEPELRVHAARMLVEATINLWKQSPVGEGRRHAATRVRELLGELQADEAIWTHADASQLREQASSVLAEMSWDIATEYEREGLEHGDRAAFASCAIESITLYNTFPDHPDRVAVLVKAADCSRRGYMISQALQLLHALVQRHPDSEQARDALFTLAETHRSVLSYREAIESYRAFVQRHPDDERVTLARTRWLQLAVTLGDPLEDTIAVWQTGTLDERMLAAAFEFRTARQAGDIEALSEYLDRHRAHGGPAREIAARVALAADAMRRSCPDSSRANGLCTVAGSDGRLGEVLHRNARERGRAERQLRTARELMRDSAWKQDPLSASGPPLAIEPQELLEVEATVALLVGDLSAEEALRVQPPRTYEVKRTRIWLDERNKSVAATISAYESVGANDPARAAAAAERTAQVYESDATLLGRVGYELVVRAKAQEAIDFARELAVLEHQRNAQALAAYQQCLAAIAAHGDDPANVQHTCKLGVARLGANRDVEVAWPGSSSLRTLVLGTK